MFNQNDPSCVIDFFLRQNAFQFLREQGIPAIPREPASGRASTHAYNFSFAITGNSFHIVHRNARAKSK